MWSDDSDGEASKNQSGTPLTHLKIKGHLNQHHYNLPMNEKY